MGLWTFILAVVAVCVAGESFKSWLKYRERARRDEGRPGVEAEFGRLRQRIEALETIVTDGGYDLRREIDRLDADRNAHRRGRSDGSTYDNTYEDTEGASRTASGSRARSAPGSGPSRHQAANG